MSIHDAKKTRFMPIAVAEVASTPISLGALWVMEKADDLFVPTQHALARAISGRPTPSESEKDPKYQAAYDRASLIVKGVGMNVAGFAGHIPLQLALEGKSDARSAGIAIAGKGVGVGISLGSILLLNKFAPSVMPSIENALMPIIEPLLPKDKKDRKSAEEVAKLIILDIPSTMIAMFANYAVARRMR